MMKKLPYILTLATIAATILIVSGAAAISQQGRSGMPQSSEQSQGKMPQHQQGMMDMMDMSAMMHEPHHQLAMAYKDNLANFAKVLRQGAVDTKTVDPDFARAAVAEMKRTFDQMQQHHQGYMNAMDEKMKAQMAGMMKQMDAHHLAIKEGLAALGKAVQTSAPDSQSISKYADDILKNCTSMSKMQGEMMNHKMAGPTDQK